MAKRTRVRARGLRKRAKTLRSPRPQAVQSGRLGFTQELLGYVRQRYENTDTPVAEIARAIGVHRTTVHAIAQREGWTRFKLPLRGLPPQTTVVSVPAAPEDASPVATKETAPARSRPDGEGTLPPLAETAGRLHRVILDELEALQTARAQMRGELQSTGEAERTARTIARLTESLQKIQRLQPTISTPGAIDEDMPADEFRYALAQRIDEFVKSRTEPGDDGGFARPAVPGMA